MMSKKLLLCFGENRRPADIASDGGLAAIKAAAYREFGDAISDSPLIQIWSSEWNSWVDLRDEDGVPAMAKINVLPQLEDLSQSLSQIDKVLDQYPYEIGEGSTSGTSTSEATSSGGASSGTATPLLHCSMSDLVACNDFCKSFALPSNFSPVVETAIQEQSMTVKTTTAFITAIARAMFALKRYPTSEEYNFVGERIVEKYPFLKAPLGNGYSHLVMRLKDRFKNFRRQPLAARPDSHSPAAEPMRKRPKKSCQWHIAPQLPDGEDELSYQRHVKSMKAEWAKRHPNSSFVEQLMKLTYPQRRQWILAEPRVASVILEECPFLESFEHLGCEFGRILGIQEADFFKKLFEKWSETSSKILSQGQREWKTGSKRISELAKMYGDGFVDISAVSRCLAGMKVMMVQLSNKRQKPAIETVIKYISENDDPEACADKSREVAPFVIVQGSPVLPSQVFLAAEQRILCPIPSSAYCPGVLLAAFYIFNTKFPQVVNTFYCCLEIILLGKTSGTVSPAISCFLTGL